MPSPRLTTVPHYTPRRFCALTLCVALAAAIACARPQESDYFPLADGSRWSYTGTFRYGGRSVPLRATAEVEGRVLVRGREYRKYVLTPELGFRGYIGDVTNLHHLRFDLVKPLTHLRASRRPQLGRQ